MFAPNCPWISTRPVVAGNSHKRPAWLDESPMPKRLKRPENQGPVAVSAKARGLMHYANPNLGAAMQLLEPAEAAPAIAVPAKTEEAKGPKAVEQKKKEEEPKAAETKEKEEGPKATEHDKEKTEETEEGPKADEPEKMEEDEEGEEEDESGVTEEEEHEPEKAKEDKEEPKKTAETKEEDKEPPKAAETKEEDEEPKKEELKESEDGQVEEGQEEDEPSPPPAKKSASAATKPHKSMPPYVTPQTKADAATLLQATKDTNFGSFLSTMLGGSDPFTKWKEKLLEPTAGVLVPSPALDLAFSRLQVALNEYNPDPIDVAVAMHQATELYEDEKHEYEVAKLHAETTATLKKAEQQKKLAEAEAKKVEAKKKLNESAKEKLDTEGDLLETTTQAAKQEAEAKVQREKAQEEIANLDKLTAQATQDAKEMSELKSKVATKANAAKLQAAKTAMLAQIDAAESKLVEAEQKGIMSKQQLAQKQQELAKGKQKVLTIQVGKALGADKVASALGTIAAVGGGVGSLIGALVGGSADVVGTAIGSAANSAAPGLGGGIGSLATGVGSVASEGGKLLGGAGVKLIEGLGGLTEGTGKLLLTGADMTTGTVKNLLSYAVTSDTSHLPPQIEWSDDGKQQLAQEFKYGNVGELLGTNATAADAALWILHALPNNLTDFQQERAQKLENAGFF